MGHFQLIILPAVLIPLGGQCNIPKPLLLLLIVSSFLLFSFYTVIYLGYFFLKRWKGFAESFPTVPELAIGQISIGFAQHIIGCSKQELKNSISFYYKMVNNQ